MKLSIALFAASVLGHSWLECIDTNVQKLSFYQKNPSQFRDEFETCKAGADPRGPGPGFKKDWISKSTSYTYTFDQMLDGKKAACRDTQRSPSSSPYKVKPGQELLMRHWGNGHSTWNPKYANPRCKDPGVIRIYWSGQAGKDLKYFEELNRANWIPGAQANFSEGAIVDYRQGVIHRPADQGDQLEMKEWANFFKFTVPKDIPNGRHQFVWAWAFDLSMAGADRIASGKKIPRTKPDVFDDNFNLSFGTCFDLEVVGSSATGPSQSQTEHRKANEGKADVDNSAACSKPCLIAGNPANVCDPAKQKCPLCRTPATPGALAHCYAECITFGTMCPDPSAKLRKHRRRSHRIGGM